MFNDSRSVTVNEDNDFNTEINSWLVFRMHAGVEQRISDISITCRKGNPYQEAASCVSEVPVRGFGGDYMTWGLERPLNDWPCCCQETKLICLV